MGELKQSSVLGRSIGAGLVGAAVGAGAVLLTQKDNRERIKKAFHALKKDGLTTLRKAEKKAADVKNKAEEKFESVHEGTS